MSLFSLLRSPEGTLCADSPGVAQDYFRFYLIAVAFIVGFGGLLAPVAEVKLGLGGAEY